MSKTKIMIWTFALVGVVLQLGTNLGWFVDGEKQAFFDCIKTGNPCAPDSIGARQFLNDFFYTRPGSHDPRNPPIEKIVLIGIFEKLRSSDDNKVQRDFVSGQVKVHNTSGDATQNLASLDELKTWAKDNPVVRWVAWILVAISVVLQGLVLICDRKAILSQNRSETFSDQDGCVTTGTPPPLA